MQWVQDALALACRSCSARGARLLERGSEMGQGANFAAVGIPRLRQNDAADGVVAQQGGFACGCSRQRRGVREYRCQARARPLQQEWEQREFLCLECAPVLTLSLPTSGIRTKSGEGVEFVELENGCACCNASDELLACIYQVRRRRQGEAA